MSVWLTGEAIHCQVSLAGNVRAAEDGQPLEGVLVKLVDRQEEARTAWDGHFHFMDLPSGQYTLHASLHGYQDVSQVVRLAKTGQKILNLQVTLPACK